MTPAERPVDVQRLAAYVCALIARGYQPPGEYWLAGLLYPACRWPRKSPPVGAVR